MKKLVVIGGGGFAKEVLWLARDCGCEIEGLLDDNVEMHGRTVAGSKVLGGVSEWSNYPECEFVIAIGSPRTRKAVYEKMVCSGSPYFAKLIHPSVIYSSSVTFGEGAIVCAGMIFTVEIAVGKHCVFNLNGTIGHECAIGDFVTVAPMAAISGNVNLEDFCEVGTGASIRQGVSIGRGAMLGMGGVLTKSIPENSIFAGNPAKLLKEMPSV